MFMFQMALPCLEATNIADLISQARVVLRKNLLVFSRCFVVESSAMF